MDGGRRENELHNGAHFPLFLTTKNSSARSQSAQAKRREKWPLSQQSWAKAERPESWANADTGQEAWRKTAVAAGKTWWMTASSESKPAWLESKEADDLDDENVAATMSSLHLRAWSAGDNLMELACAKDHAAPKDEDVRKWWSSSDWDWSWSHCYWKDDQGWWR